MRRARRGSHAVELAAVAPLFVAVLGGVLELAFLVGASERVSTIAHVAAEVGAATVEGPVVTGGEATAAAEAYATAALADAGIACGAGCSVQATWAQDAATDLFTVKVSLVVPRAPITGVGFAGTTLRAEATAFSVQQD